MIQFTRYNTDENITRSKDPKSNWDKFDQKQLSGYGRKRNLNLRLIKSFRRLEYQSINKA